MKQQEIVKMFDSIAKKYDCVNRVLTLGIDKKWRKVGVKEALKELKGKKILDVACGTGDMIEIWRSFGDFEVCGLDPSVGMLEVAKKRFRDVKFYRGFATDIPCPDNHLDGISISFGLRNVVETEKAIKEFKRVLKKDGIVLVIEFMKAERDTIFRKMIDFYSYTILPVIGGIISQNLKAYKYLPASIDKFYTPAELIKLFEKEGFEIKRKRLFNFGQVGVFVFKLSAPDKI